MNKTNTKNTKSRKPNIPVLPPSTSSPSMFTWNVGGMTIKKNPHEKYVTVYNDDEAILSLKEDDAYEMGLSVFHRAKRGEGEHSEEWGRALVSAALFSYEE